MLKSASRPVATSLLVMILMLLSACSGHFFNSVPRFAQLTSELERARYSGRASPVNSQEWVEEVNDTLEYGHSFFYSDSEESWVLGSHDVQFDLFSFDQLNADEVRPRLGVPGRDGSDAGGATVANEVYVQVRPEAEPIQRLFRDGEVEMQEELRLAGRSASDAITLAKAFRELIAENPDPSR